MVENNHTVTTESRFQDALCMILEEATKNGVTVEDGWTCRSGENLPDWEVTIERVEKPFPSSSDQ